MFFPATLGKVLLAGGKGLLLAQKAWNDSGPKKYFTRTLDLTVCASSNPENWPSNLCTDNTISPYTKLHSKFDMIQLTSHIEVRLEYWNPTYKKTHEEMRMDGG